MKGHTSYNGSAQLFTEYFTDAKTELVLPPSALRALKRSLKIPSTLNVSLYIAL